MSDVSGNNLAYHSKFGSGGLRKRSIGKPIVPNKSTTPEDKIAAASASEHPWRPWQSSRGGKSSAVSSSASSALPRFYFERPRPHPHTHAPEPPKEETEDDGRPETESSRQPPAARRNRLGQWPW